MFRQKAIVLMYHRIAETEIDPWQLAVTPRNFEEQLYVLKKFNIISSEELINNLTNKSIKSKSICLTFDDGYVDNYTEAKPLLEKYETPATFFITSQSIGKQRQFWWDELGSMFLETGQLPEALSIKIGEKQFSVRIESSVLLKEDWEKHKSWKWPDEPPTERCNLYLTIWTMLKPLPYNQIEQVIKELKLWAGSVQSSKGDRIAMNIEQLDNLFNHHLITIGAHTVSHPSLSCHSKEIQREEISNSKNFLQDNGSRPISTVAYPYGSYNTDTMMVVKDLKFSAGFTTDEQAVFNSSDASRLGRFQVNNWNGEEFEKQLYKWFKSN